MSWHFAPSRAVGALRWRKLLAHAPPDFAGVDVLSLHPRDVPAVDRATLDDLPAGTRLFGVPAPRLARDRLEALVVDSKRWLRGVLRPWRGGTASAHGAPAFLSRHEVPARPRTLTDWRRTYHAGAERARERQWIDRALAAAHMMASDGAAYAAVVSSGPPHAAHEVAEALAARWDIPFVMDLRDPWSQQEHLPESYASAGWYRDAARAEARAVARAAVIFTTTGPAADALRARYPDAADRIRTLPNGYDDEPLPLVPPPQQFRIAYAGTIYLDRDPTPLFAAAAQLIARHRLPPESCTIEFMGHVRAFNGRNLTDLARASGVAAHLRLHPPAPRASALRFLAGASVLVSLPQASRLAVPAKIFEYVRFPAACLVLAPPGSATAELLRDTAADVVDPSDVPAIAAALDRHYERHRRGDRPRPVAEGWDLSRRATAAQLYAELDAVLRGSDVAREA